jgi:sugar phosphate isomerase/epimerase
MEFNYGNEPAGYIKYGNEGPVNDTSDLGQGNSSDIENSIIYPGDIGQSVTEGSRFGTFVQTVTGAIRTGASKVELQTGMAGGQEAVGAESYGQEARQALRELAKANEIELTSVHAPTQIGNVSGFNPQQGFVDEQRKSSVEEIKKAIDFASEVTGGGTITFHTGEYQRPISEQDWALMKDENGKVVTDSEGNKQYQFLGYQEEPGKAVTYMVDNRHGKIIGDVRKSNIIREPVYLTADRDYKGFDVDGKPVVIQKGDLITEEGNYIDRANPDHLFKRVAKWNDNLKRFETEKLVWDDIERRKDSWNMKHPDKAISTEEMAYRIQIETQIMQYRGHSLYHGRMYNEEKKERDAIKEALKFYTELENKIPPEEVWKIMKEDPKSKRYVRSDLVGTQQKKPTEILQEALVQAEQSLQYTHQSSGSADAQADTLKDTLEHVKPIAEYAQEKSSISLAEAAIHAWQKTNEGKMKGLVNRDIILTPENIFPEMGYGSHPEELKDFVKSGRNKMIEYLTKKKIKDPHNRLTLVKDPVTGELKEEIRMVDNPYYKGFNEAEAKKIADAHIKANLDTQHLGMWGKHFQEKYLKDKGRMETPEETKDRFRKWYNQQVKMLADEGIIGEVHIVDGYMSGGHTHLPVGQGELPVVDAVKYLREKGFKGVMISEGHGEESWGPGRIMTKAWEAFGSPVFSSGYFGASGGGFGAPVRWTDIDSSYFQKKQGPYFVFGGYSPSNDWTLWSEVPLE